MISTYNDFIGKKRTGSIKFLVFFSLLLLLGCAYHDTGPPPPCSCEAPVTKSFQSVPGVMVNTTSGFLFLSIGHGFYNVCNDLDTALLKDGLLVIASGRLKTSCPRPADRYKEEQQSFVLLDQWQVSQDSTFNIEYPAIRLIHSEDFGYPVGFGYEIAYPGFNIRQGIIPVIQGIHPFKTRTAAFKMAVLVAYKLNIGHPAITLEDLYFFKFR